MKWALIAATVAAIEAASAIGLGRFLRAGAREMPPAPGDGQSPPGVASPAPGPTQEDDLKTVSEWTTWTDEQANAALRLHYRKQGIYPYRKAPNPGGEGTDGT